MTNNIRKQPLPLCTKSWLGDMDLRACTPNDRGLLLDVMCLAQEGNPYGFVTLSNGDPLPDAQIANVMNVTVTAWKEARKRLIDAGRIHVAEGTKALMIPRMVRDGEIKQAAIDAGSRGGNPKLTGGTEKVKRSRQITAKYFYKQLPERLHAPEVKAAVEEWFEYRTKKRHVLTKGAVTRQVNTLKHLNPEKLVLWIACSIDKQWRGIYPPPDGYVEYLNGQKKERAVAGEKAKRARQDQKDANIKTASDQLWALMKSELTTGADKGEDIQRCAEKLRDQFSKKLVVEAFELVNYRKEVYKDWQKKGGA